MKTTKIITALSLLLVFGIANVLFATNKNINDPQSVDKVKLISYVVQVDNSQHFNPGNMHYKVVMTDGSGRLVAPPQTFIPGVWVYRFTEPGNVRGTRVARMITSVDPITSQWAIRPVSKTGIFLGDRSYDFKLVPIRLGVAVDKPKE